MVLIRAFKFSAALIPALVALLITGAVVHAATSETEYTMEAPGGDAGSESSLALSDGESAGLLNDMGREREWSGKQAFRLETTDLILAQLETVPSEQRGMDAPEGVETNVSPNGDQWQIDLAWTAPSGPPGALFVVELVTIPSTSDGESALVAFQQTEAMATTVLVDRVPVGLALRVSQVAADGSDYAAGDWTELSPGTDISKAETALAPVGRVTIRVGAADMPARQLATELAGGLAAGGMWVHLEEVALELAESTVIYRFAADAELASGVAGYLPVLGPGDAIRRADIAAAPGEVVVTLVGGPTGVEGSE